ncbi:hypothetical protein WEI85_31735 [Actinomycetes bacterium KLBMP 9797]
MSSNSAGPVHNAPAVASAVTTADRAITALTVWWLAFPVAICAGVGIFAEPSRYAFWDAIGKALLWVGLGGAAVAPAAGIVVALIGRRRRACWRFALMGAVSISGAVLVQFLPA